VKKVFYVIIFLVCTINFVQSRNQYDQKLTERNVLYNELQTKLYSDTVSPLKKLEMWQNLVSLDNEIIDDWIPSLFKEIDSLNTLNARKEHTFREKKQRLTERMKLFMYIGAGIAFIAFVFGIMIISGLISRKKLKRRLDIAIQAERDRDAYKSALDDKITEAKNLTTVRFELEHKISLLESEKSQLTEEYQTSLQSLESESERIRAELQNLSEVLDALKTENDDAKSKLQTTALQKDQAFTKLQEEFQNSVNHFRELIHNEREESIKKLREHEILLDELRNELRQAKSLLDEKERNDSHRQFREVTDANEESNRLRRMYDEQKEIIEEYRIALEKELESRKELESLLKDLLKK
jgi:hypothetical protein